MIIVKDVNSKYFSFLALVSFKRDKINCSTQLMDKQYHIAYDVYKEYMLIIQFSQTEIFTIQFLLIFIKLRFEFSQQ